MPYPLIFLVGLHGVGKSTIGRAMSANHGYRHISLGDLGRLLRSRLIPSGYSLRFLRLLAGHVPGERMSAPLVEALNTEIVQHRLMSPLVIDGFPCEPYHVMGLPSKSVLIHLTCENKEREARLLHRSETTRRKWNHGQESLRDRQIGAVCEVAKECAELNFLEIDTSGMPVDHIAKNIAIQASEKRQYA